MYQHKEQVLRICGGNPGCIRVVTQLLSMSTGATPQTQTPRIDKLEELGYRRSLIWLIYKDLLDGDLNRMGELLDNNQLADEIERRIQEDENFAKQWRYHEEHEAK